MIAKEYKKHGYTHVLVEITNFEIKPIITKGFHSYRQMKNHRDNMNLHEINTSISKFMTVNQAIKKGY